MTLAAVMLFASRHALDRYREHYPDAEERDLLASVEEARSKNRELSAPVVQGMLQRREMDRAGTVYLVPENGRGLFIVATSGAVITYLRFQPSQQSMVRRWLSLPEPTPEETAPDLVIPPGSSWAPRPGLTREHALLYKEELAAANRLMRGQVTALQAELTEIKRIKEDICKQMAEIDLWLRANRQPRQVQH